MKAQPININPPDTCEIIDDGAALRVSWQGGRSSRLEAAFLWQRCPSAAGRRRRMDGQHHAVPRDLKLTKLVMIGHYAVNLGFSDGHDRGVYPWSLLARFSAEPTIDDFIIDAGTTAAVPSPTTPGAHRPANAERQ